ncbi:MAG: PIN domain-containing protein [Spirochaetales bacterium]|nr:PIN domain-containing protein [Spirochaetales bacterium]
MIYFLDSNIISYLLKGDERLKALIADKLLQGDRVMIPRVVYYEVKRGLLACGATSKIGYNLTSYFLLKKNIKFF